MSEPPSTPTSRRDEIELNEVVKVSEGNGNHLGKILQVTHPQVQTVQRKCA
jgi:hypothetical protein